ncbi:MAG: Hsp70 family protein [Desulfatibacillaceae bacterium]
MDPHDKRYIIGIDLGTTNSALSWVDREKDPTARGIKHFKVPQVTAPGETSRLGILPSFLYLPGEYDLREGSLVLPWDKNPENAVGMFAREQGASVPGRLVSSAKSWLCHGKVDRTAKILPWNADEGVPRVSPVQATAAYLSHLRAAWNHFMGEDEEYYLENQFVIITVPASFDEVARDFTVEAAKTAGLSNITLLEEPLAAFYSWLVFHEKDWDQHVSPGELICAVDVGGGTSDFTLITLREVSGSPRFERIAVGDHLILGGDNMDLALARTAENAMRKGKKGSSLSANRWQALTHQCRQAKERILSGELGKKTVTLMGEGKKLIADTLSASLDRETIEQVILDGFFPLVDANTPAPDRKKAGITEFGLPYEQDAAVTRHLCLFLERHAGDVRSMLEKDRPRPELLLFNGGALKPGVLQQRVRESVANWFGGPELPRILENPDLDLAVSRGAAYYGLVKAGLGVRVGSGSARGYYLQVGTSEDNGAEKAICLVERGMEEGTRIDLGDRNFEVLANQPVSFQMFSSSFRSGDKPGDLVDVDETLTRMPPMRTVIQFGKKAGQVTVPVTVEGDFTEMGTLALWARAVSTDHRWRLSFQLRDVEKAADVKEARIIEESLVQAARDIIEATYTSKKADPQPPERLSNAIADIVEMTREKWPLTFIRRLADDLVEVEKGRAQSAEHEARWLNLTGFCMRPGFGDALDEHRIKKLWPLFKKGPAWPKNQQVRQEWWVLWRRLGGGLTAGQQRQVLQDLMSVVKQKGGGRDKVPAQERLEIWMMLANLERLSARDKAELGATLLAELHHKKARAQQWWALSRFGARELLYGPLDRVVPPEEVAKWIDAILSTEWKNPRPAANTMAQMARKTGDRKRDLDDAVVQKVLDWLEPFDWKKPMVRMLTRVVAVDRQEENQVFGESLPTGMVLKDSGQ